METYKIRVVVTPSALTEDVREQLHCRGIRARIEYVADTTGGAFRGWRMGDGGSIGCLFVTSRIPVWYDRTIGLSAWRWLRHDREIDFGVIPIDLNESRRQELQKGRTRVVASYFEDWLRDAIRWERLKEGDRRRLYRRLLELHRDAVGAPVAQLLVDRIFDRIVDISEGVYCGEVSTFDAKERWYE